MSVNMRLASSLLLAIAACAARPGPNNVTAPPATRAALAARPSVWSERDKTAALFPRSIGRLQIVVTPGWAEGEHYAWLISNGTDVVRVFRARSTEIGEIVDAAIKTVYPTVGTPLDQLSIGVLGVIHKPPPPPPDPGGLPEGYVQQVMHTAWGIDQQQAKVGAQLGGPVGH
jgi:hypothetical protein